MLLQTLLERTFVHAQQKMGFLVPSLEQEASHQEVGLRGIWEIWVLIALGSRDISKADLSMCFEPISTTGQFVMLCPISVSSQAAKGEGILERPL